MVEAEVPEFVAVNVMEFDSPTRAGRKFTVPPLVTLVGVPAAANE